MQNVTICHFLIGKQNRMGAALSDRHFNKRLERVNAAVHSVRPCQKSASQRLIIHLKLRFESLMVYHALNRWRINA